MDEETYFYGEDAVENGFVDAVAEEVVKNKIDWDMSAYANNPPPKNIKKTKKKSKKKTVKNKSSSPSPITNLEHLRRKFALTEKSVNQAA